jgi:hypothetical protein
LDSSFNFNQDSSELSSESVSNDDIERLKAGLMQFIVTMKNLSLYPETNKTNIESVSFLHLWLNEYLSHNSPLVLEVEKNKLLYNDIVVYQEKSTDQILVGPLFRDGVQTLIFEAGLNETELRTFLTVVLKFRNQTDSIQDDVVSALWEASLTNIRYTVSNDYVQVGPEFELTAMKVAKPTGDMRMIQGATVDGSPLDNGLLDPLAPATKPIASLFALAESTHVVVKGSDGGDGAQPGADGDSDDAIEVADSGLDVGGFGPMGGDSSLDDDGGFGGDWIYGTIGASISARGRPRTTNKDAKSGSGPGDGSQGTDPNKPSSHGSASPPEDRASALGRANSPDAAKSPEEDLQLDIDIGSVAEAFQSLKDVSSPGPDEAKSGPPLSLKSIKERPKETSEKLAKRLKNWALSDEEVRQIEALIKWDSSRNYSYDTLEIINTTIESPIFDDAQMPLIANFLVNELKNSIKRWDLKYFNSFFLNLRRKADAGGQNQTFLSEELTQKLGTPEVLSFLTDPKPSDEQISGCYEDLRYFLYQLPPPGFHVLISLLPKVSNLQLWNLFLEVIAYELLRTGGRTFNLISQLGVRALTHVINILKPNLSSLPQAMIQGLIRHKSAAIRETIARALLEVEPDSFHSQCAHMVLDPDQGVLKLVRPALSSRRNPVVENHLFSYLRESYTRDRQGEDPQLLSCYRVYGHCASSRAVPFLEEILLRKDFKTFISRTADNHKLGAALALFLMPDDPAAKKALDKAGRSAFKSVRQSYLEAEALVKGRAL